MRKIIRYIITCMLAVVFNYSAFANDYDHTIEYLTFQGYEYYGIDCTVTTNVDTEEDMTLYLAIYSEDGRICEVTSKLLEQNQEGERKVYRIKVSTILDETMTVKAMIWKNMIPYAESISVKYDKKYNSGQTLIIPDTGDIELKINNQVSKETDETILEEYTKKDIVDISSKVITYPIQSSTGIVDAVTTIPENISPYDEDYVEGKGRIVAVPISPDESITDKHGCTFLSS